MHPSQASELPVRAALRPDGLYMELRDIGIDQLQDPFLQETVERVHSQSTVVHIRRQDLGRAPPGTAPAGMIFHVGRCGSTLVSQLLRQHDGVVVYAEPLAVNDILVPPQGGSRAELVGVLRTLGACFARHAGKPWVLKLSSWNALYCDLVVDAFPSTPWVMCLRDPVEVCVSLLERRPGWLRDAGEQSHRFAAVVDPGRTSATVEEYLARLVGAYCTAIGRLDLRRGLLVDYRTLPEAVWGGVAPRFGLAVDEHLRERMLLASRADSKAPLGSSVTFTPDASRKHAAASLALRQVVDAYARPALDRLIAGFSGS